MNKIILQIALAFFMIGSAIKGQEMCTDSLGNPIILHFSTPSAPMCPEGLDPNASIGVSFSTVTGESFCYCVASGCVFYWTNDNGFESGPASHTISNVEAGVYHLVGQKPSGCIVEGDYEVVSTIPPFFEGIEKSDILCGDEANGSATVLLAPLSGQFNFLWDTGETTETVSNLTPGEHSVLVTNFNGCTHTEYFTIEAPESLMDSLQVVNSCQGQSNGSVNMWIYGGVSPYSCYLNGVLQSNEQVISGLAPGDYELVIMDSNSCSNTRMFTVEEIPVQASISGASTTVCSGQSIELTALGGNQFLWDSDPDISNPNSNAVVVSPTSNTTYTCMITNGAGCAMTASYTITVSELEAPVITVNDTDICAGSTINVQANVPGSGISYHWSPEFGVANPNSNATTITPPASTTYTLTASNAQGCESESMIAVTVNVCNGIAELNGKRIQLLPNPVQQYLNFTGLDRQTEMNVYNNAGQLVLNSLLLAGDNQVSFDTVSSGIYFVQLIQNNEIVRFKIVKE